MKWRDLQDRRGEAGHSHRHSSSGRNDRADQRYAGGGVRGLRRVLFG